MNCIKGYLLIAFGCLCISQVSAQELNCQVQVIAPTLQSSPANQEIITSLQSSVYDFVNNTRWTTDVYEDHERIECSILINISTKTGSDRFSGSIQVSSTRPVFNSDYKSRLFNFNDENFIFQYLRNTAIIFQQDRHKSNLADVIAFYVYMILGYDYDSFAPEGGTPYFNKAQQIVTNCANAGEPGWKPQESQRNRYWLIQNHTQALFKPLRRAYYDYHRLGFDILYQKKEAGMNVIVSSLEKLESIHKTRPNSFNVQLFFTAKADEIVGLFIEAFPDVRTKVYNILAKIDPGNISKYNKIKQGKK